MVILHRVGSIVIALGLTMKFTELALRSDSPWSSHTSLSVAPLAFDDSSLLWRSGE